MTCSASRYIFILLMPIICGTGKLRTPLNVSVGFHPNQIHIKRLRTPVSSNRKELVIGRGSGYCARHRPTLEACRLLGARGKRSELGEGNRRLRLRKRKENKHVFYSNLIKSPSGSNKREREKKKEKSQQIINYILR